MICYHATSWWNWTHKIQKEGLVPYLLDEKRNIPTTESIGPALDKLGISRNIIWLWPQFVANRALFRDFLYWKWSRNGVRDIAILKWNKYKPLILKKT